MKLNKLYQNVIMRKGMIKMSRTFELYDAMNDFRKAQILNRKNYLAMKNSLDRYSGSAGYADDLRKIQEEREKANASARAACKAKIDPIFKAMHEANAKRGITAPSEESVRILTVVKMMKKPSKTFMDCVANSLGGNSLALVALDQIVRDAWKDDPDISERWTPTYSTGRAAKELDPQAAAEAINGLQRTCNDILSSSGANRVREKAADRNSRVHGGRFDPDALPQEPEYMTEKDFYERECSADYSLFAAAVNA